jgi:hypothetical protein
MLVLYRFGQVVKHIGAREAHQRLRRVSQASTLSRVIKFRVVVFLGSSPAGAFARRPVTEAQRQRPAEPV